MTTVFKLSDINKKYGKREVLSINDLQIEEGHLYSILGPNGAGKTTLLRIMSLLTVNNYGSLQVLGENIDWSKKQLLRIRRQMAMVTQTSYMFEGTVYYNVAYGLRVRKSPEAEQKKIVNECLELLGMSAFSNQSARSLSGGERQKAAIARALAVKPRVLFLDEPTSNIDPVSALEIENYVRFIKEKYGTTIILITHNLFQARRLAEHIFFLWEGKMIEQGKTEDLFDIPQDTRTRAFLKGETFF